MFTGMHRKQAPFGTAVLETVAAAKAEPGYATAPGKIKGPGRQEGTRVTTPGFRFSIWGLFSAQNLETRVQPRP